MELMWAETAGRAGSQVENTVNSASLGEDHSFFAVPIAVLENIILPYSPRSDLPNAADLEEDFCDA
jgi:hypothetical protein